ncbi:hypothetical protein EsH8_VII_000014 [Colletotrichum jinshuiense]
MLSFTSIVYTSAFLAVAQGHGVLLNAVGDSGASVGFLVDPNIARNCTNINPCQQDATIIRDAEINANVVNECGRTEIAGNIDIGENTENALAAGQVTKVKAGSQIQVTIHQVNADGAGPYSCDLDPTSNSLGGTGQIPLEVTNNVPGVNGFSQAKTQQFNVTVTLPADLKCTGASTGDVCTVRCRNNAVAGPFGGCFAVQQTDVTATKNTPQNIKTAAKLNVANSQQQLNIADLPDAIKANQIDGTDDQKAKVAAANALLGVPDVVVKESPVQNTGADTVTNNNGTADAGNAAGNTGNNNNNNNNNNKNNNNNAGGATGNGGKGRAGANAGANGAARGGRKNNQKRQEDNQALRWAKRDVGVSADFDLEVAP